ncbi:MULTISPECIES: hypothetical protein [unclassified Streptomyces]|uniref:hypothetical protein n=1 Tax=Streptomyces sp. NPDC055082 TaxID=3365718 RepID=UPI0037CED706
MSESTPNSKGPAPATYKPAVTEPALTPVDQVKPEDIGTLAIEYRDGQPVIVVSGGTYIAGGLRVVDRSGNAVAAYEAKALNQTRYIGQSVLHCDLLDGDY